MGMLYVIWIFLSFLIGDFIINRVTDNTYIQYVGGMRQRPEYRPLENSKETSVLTDWIQRENEVRGQWAD